MLYTSGIHLLKYWYYNLISYSWKHSPQNLIACCWLSRIYTNTLYKQPTFNLKNQFIRITYWHYKHHNIGHSCKVLHLKKPKWCWNHKILIQENISFHFAIVVIATLFNHLAASPSASWSLVSPPSNFVDRHMSTTWWSQSQRSDVTTSTTWALACVKVI